MTDPRGYAVRRRSISLLRWSVEITIGVLFAFLLCAGPAAAAETDGEITFAYTGQATEQCHGCMSTTQGPNNNVEYVNDVGIQTVEYDWTIVAEIPLDISPTGKLSHFGRIKWLQTDGHGSITTELTWNCIDFEEAVFGQSGESQCGNPGKPGENHTPSLYVPWLKSSTGGDPKLYTSQRNALKLALKSPLNASAVKVTGSYLPNKPSVENSSLDWQFPIWEGSYPNWSCVWNYKQLNRQWADIDNPTIKWYPSDGYGHDVTRRFNYSADKTLPASRCATGTYSYVGDASYDTMEVRTEVKLNIERR
jgi:hypothetical protein